MIDKGVCEDNSCGSLVVGLCDVFEPFLAGGVPDLHFHFFAIEDEGLDFEVDSDGGDVGLFEMIFAEAGDEVGFADTAVADDDDLKKIPRFSSIFSIHFIISTIYAFQNLTIYELSLSHHFHIFLRDFFFLATLQ